MCLVPSRDLVEQEIATVPEGCSVRNQCSSFTTMGVGKHVFLAKRKVRFRAFFDMQLVVSTTHFWCESRLCTTVAYD
jgi:hypothetical protein